jgi:histidyl-tRNA synthetase
MALPETSRPATTQARKPRGFPDRREGLLHAEREMIARVTAVYRNWGFEALDTGAFEYVDALGKFLPDTDRPNEGVFALQDDDAQWIALRYDLTAPLARFAAEHWAGLPKPFRRYAFGPVWRNEKPGPTRFREFIQCDADTVGTELPASDAEMVAMAAQAIEAAGAAPGEFVIRVNTRKLLNAALDKAGAQETGTRLTVLRALDKLDRLGADGVRELLGAGRKDESGDFTKGAGLDGPRIETLIAFALAGRGTRGQTLEELARVVHGVAEGDAGIAELSAIELALSGLGVADRAVAFDPAVVRGLEYYTGPVFEAELLREVRGEDGVPVRVGSVGGGGRYDDLVARFTGERVPATGFSVGISRLASAFALAGGVSRLDGPVVVLSLDAEHLADSLALATQLRRAGIRAEAYLGTSGMRAQMKYADRRDAPAVVIVGSDERAAGTVTIKDLAAGAAAAAGITDNAEWKAARPGQFTVPRAEMIARLHAILAETAAGTKA